MAHGSSDDNGTGTTLSRQTSVRVDESEGMRGRVRAAATSLRLYWEAQARQLSFSESLGWAEGGLKRQARNSDGDAAIEVLSVPSVFRVDRFVLVGLANRAG